MKVEYIINTPFTMKILIDGEKEILVTGEGTTIPEFYADKSSLKNWQPPYDSTPITRHEKEEIIKIVEKMSQKGKVKVIFD